MSLLNFITRLFGKEEKSVSTAPSATVSGGSAGLPAGAAVVLSNGGWRVIARIEGVPILYSDEKQILRWTADMDIDNDGSGGNPDGDKCHQSETSYQVGGVSLNPYKVPFAVVPLSVINLVKPMVLGSHCVIGYGGREIDAVVGDLGPEKKVGEASVEAAKRLRINPSPVNGGLSELRVTYTIFCGQPALVDGVRYRCIPWKTKKR